MPIITYIDLFCGIGAFHRAFDMSTNDRVKFKNILSCDISETAQKLYKANYNITPLGDIKKINFTKLEPDILCAGFPCQPFSNAGKKQGFADKDKGDLFSEVLRAIDECNPNTVILENVKNLITINKGSVLKFICNELTDRNYIVSYKLLDSKKYGSPQSRQRVFIIGVKDFKYKFTEPDYKFQYVKDILDNNVTEYYEYDNKYYLEPTIGNGSMIYKLINKKTKKGGRQGERVYSVERHGCTICASGGGPGSNTGLYMTDSNNKKIRQLTVNECIKMFGFPDTFKTLGLSDKTILFHLGNSIVVPVLIHIIRDLCY